MNKLWCCSIAAALLFLSGGYAGAAATMVAKTNVVFINPASVTVTRTVRGHCWTSSIASRRSDAYRCMAGNEIHDPCFATSGTGVVCPANPSANTGLRISLVKPLPVANRGNGRNPWMMQLAGGITCNIGTGTRIPDYPFYCTRNLVCAAPASTNLPAIFITCGRPKSSISVTATSRYLVTVMYE
jgi:hypothetical protein